MREPSEMVLADLIRIRAEQSPELDVLTFEHLSLDGGATPDEIRSYADLDANAQRIAKALLARGLQPGDRFGVMLRNHPELVEAAIAASITATLFVPIDPRTRGEKLAHVLRNSGCAGLICADQCLAAVDAQRAGLPELRFVLGVTTGEDTPLLSDFPGVEPLAEALGAPPASLDVRAEPGTPLQLMYTSGTLGNPKGIAGDNARFCAAGILGRLFGYGVDERPYTGLSLTHGNAQSVTLAPALSMGLRAIFSRRFTKSRLWDVCRHHSATSFSLVGGMATSIYSEPARADDASNPVRLVVSGGMPAPIWEAFEKRFDVRILEFYGAMDGGGMAYKPVGRGPVGSFGKPMPGLEMKILDEHGRECTPGVVAEICTRPAGAPAPAVDYHGDPEAGRTKVRGGWNRSGDMGHRDENGWLFFDHRSGGGIRHNGDFIHPGFVEKAIAEHPHVSDVFVYGVPAASRAPGEKDVVAAIVFAAGAPRDPASVFAACRGKLEPNFVPNWLQVLEEIPKTASEKPQERVLLEHFDPDAPGIHAREGTR